MDRRKHWRSGNRKGRAARGRSIFFFQAEDGIRDYKVTGVQTCALPISGVGGGGGTLPDGGGGPGTPDTGGCGCQSAGATGAAILFAMTFLLSRRARRAGGRKSGV